MWWSKEALSVGVPTRQKINRSWATPTLLPQSFNSRDFQLSKVHYLWPVMQANFIKTPHYYRPSLSFYFASTNVSQKLAWATFATTSLIKHKTAVQMMYRAKLQRMLLIVGFRAAIRSQAFPKIRPNSSSRQTSSLN